VEAATSKQQPKCHKKCFFWPPFATSLPQKSESKVASTQSKQGNAVMNGVWRSHAFPRRGAAQAACFEKAGKRAEIIRTYGKV
jgi:hypothetical protein